MFHFRVITTLILLIAFGLRVWAIDKIPLGLSHDEANNGMAALQVIDGARPIFFEINKGIEPLIIYLEALAFYSFGIHPTTLRFVNIFFGQLTVALIFPITCRLFNRQVAIIAMAGLAVSFWAIFVSRLTLRAVLLPPFLLVVLYTMWRGLFSRHWRAVGWLMISGVFSGMAMYTYLSSRFVPLLILTFFGWLTILTFIGRPSLAILNRWHGFGLLLHVTIWAIILLPLMNYYGEHQASFNERANQVTTIPHALNGEFGPMLSNTVRTLGMFTFQGDTTDRYNLDGRPIFDWLNGLIFYGGVFVMIWQTYRCCRHYSSHHNWSLFQLGGNLSKLPALTPNLGYGRYIISRNSLIILWLIIMLLPDFITDDSPHFLRTIGVLPLVYIIWAMGLVGLVDWLTPKIQPRYGQPIIYSSLIVLMLGHTSYDYFYRWANAPEARYIYGADIAEIADYMHRHPTDEKTVTAISSEYYRDLDQFRFALHWQNNPPFAIWFDGRQSIAIPPPEFGLETRYLFAHSALIDEDWHSLLTFVPAESGHNYRFYHLPDRFTSAQINHSNRLNHTFNNEVLLLSYEWHGAVKTAGQLQLIIAWQALKALPPGTDYTFLARLTDEQGQVWAEADDLGYSPADWQPGVLGLQRLILHLPGDLPQTKHNLTIELINRHTKQALSTTDGQSVIVLETVENHGP